VRQLAGAQRQLHDCPDVHAFVTGTEAASLSITDNASGSGRRYPVWRGTHDAILSWAASTIRVVGYNVYRGTTSGGRARRLELLAVNGTTYTDATVQAGQTYYYVTRAVRRMMSPRVQTRMKFQLPCHHLILQCEVMLLISLDHVGVATRALTCPSSIIHQ